MTKKPTAPNLDEDCRRYAYVLKHSPGDVQEALRDLIDVLYAKRKRSWIWTPTRRKKKP